ncbi:MAG: class I SAM-dependent methyltransferase [Candidatus Omnitrophica bacterium]|nr:class I SAM-dependent methyltransferase [Candidatus Omnitrophota bacterium]
MPDIAGPETFSIEEWDCCSVMKTVPVPDDLSRYYQADVGILMKSAPGRIHSVLKNILLSMELNRILRRIEPGMFVDIGCGTGDFSRLIWSRGFPVLAVDSQPERPLLLKERQDVPYARIDYDRCRIENPGIRGCATAIIRHVLEHVKEPAMLLNNLRESGVSSFYVVVPNTGCFERRLFGRYWNLWDPPRHLWHFNSRSLFALFDRLGIRIVDRGTDTIPNWVPSFYRFLRLRRFPARFYELFNPKGMISSLSTPLNFLTPCNVLWVLGKAA